MNILDLKCNNFLSKIRQLWKFVQNATASCPNCNELWTLVQKATSFCPKCNKVKIHIRWYWKNLRWLTLFLLKCHNLTKTRSDRTEQKVVAFKINFLSCCILGWKLIHFGPTCVFYIGKQQLIASMLNQNDIITKLGWIYHGLYRDDESHFLLFVNTIQYIRRQGARVTRHYAI